MYVLQTCGNGLFNNLGLGTFQNQVILGNTAQFPLCFPQGFPFSFAQGSCYNPGFPGSIPPSAGPCLPPIIQGRLIPPCVGPYVKICY